MHPRSEWTSIGGPYYSKQWPFCEAASRILSRLGDIERVLEVGPYTHPMYPGCVSMDINHSPKVVHDAGIAPWPFEDKSYDLCVALQVFEHLGPKESIRHQIAFSEAFRVAPIVVVSLPYHWPERSKNNHGGIGLLTILDWASGREPDYVTVISQNSSRILCVWGDRMIEQRPDGQE